MGGMGGGGMIPPPGGMGGGGMIPPPGGMGGGGMGGGGMGGGGMIPPPSSGGSENKVDDDSFPDVSKPKKSDSSNPKPKPKKSDLDEPKSNQPPDYDELSPLQCPTFLIFVGIYNNV